MTLCYIGLGGNLGDSQQIFTNVIHDLNTTPQIILQKVSSFYCSKPLDNANQPPYLNAVVCVDTEFSSHQFLDVLQALEKKYGRVRGEMQWDSRTLDLDILIFGAQIINDERLTIPHCGISLRDFVLYPLYEIAPSLDIPGLGPVKTLVSQCENRGLEKL